VKQPLSEDIVKLLLTSGGINNASIHDALIDPLGKPTADSNALRIPTAQHGHPMCTPASAWRFIAGKGSDTHMCALGWKSMGVLELTALPSIDKERWSRGSGRLTSYWWTVARRHTCATGCGSPGWRTSCRRCRVQADSVISVH
jgi:dipeptidase E